MIKLLIGLTLLTSMSSFAGTFSYTNQNGELVTSNIDHIQILSHTVTVMPKIGTTCNVSMERLKELGIDPISLATSLKKSNVHLFCTNDTGFSGPKMNEDLLFSIK